MPIFEVWYFPNLSLANTLNFMTLSTNTLCCSSFLEWYILVQNLKSLNSLYATYVLVTGAIFTVPQHVCAITPRMGAIMSIFSKCLAPKIPTKPSFLKFRTAFRPSLHLINFPESHTRYWSVVCHTKSGLKYAIFLSILS